MTAAPALVPRERMGAARVRKAMGCNCDGVLCGARVYRCAGCRRTRFWCDGAHDDAPDMCDRCWAKRHGAGEGGEA